MSVRSTTYSSMFPAASTPSMSMSSSRFRIRATVSGSAMPSSHSTSTGVRDCRPTMRSPIFSSGARRRRRTREVLVRTLSTKESRAPFRGGSFSGSPTERFSSVATGTTTAVSGRSGRNRAQAPSIRARATLSISRSAAACWAYSAPRVSRASSSAGSARASCPSWARGRNT